MSKLTKPIDVTRPEDYQLRAGNKVLALAKYKNGDILVVYKFAGEPDSLRVDSDGLSSHNESVLSTFDLIEKPKKMWKNMSVGFGYSAWFDSKAEADLVVKHERIGYLTFTDPNDFSTYELVPLEGEIENE